MIKAELYDQFGNTLSWFYQWDVGYSIQIGGVVLDPVPVVYLGTVHNPGSYVVTPTVSNSRLIVHIPNVLLQQDSPILVFLEYSGIIGRIPIVPRSIPDNYIPVDDSSMYSGSLYTGK